jgi:hypothetical protein
MGSTHVVPRSPSPSPAPPTASLTAGRLSPPREALPALSLTGRVHPELPCGLTRERGVRGAEGGRRLVVQDHEQPIEPCALYVILDWSRWPGSVGLCCYGNTLGEAMAGWGWMSSLHFRASDATIGGLKDRFPSAAQRLRCFCTLTRTHAAKCIPGETHAHADMSSQEQPEVVSLPWGEALIGQPVTVPSQSDPPRPPLPRPVAAAVVMCSRGDDGVAPSSLPHGTSRGTRPEPGTGGPGGASQQTQPSRRLEVMTRG